MTRYSDNIYSGFQGVTSATTSKSCVRLGKTYKFGGASVSLSGVFPPNTENLSANLYIMKVGGSATTSDTIVVSAGGTNLITITGIGSADGMIGNGVTAGKGSMTVIASAANSLTAPTSSNNGGEIPFTITYVAASAGGGTQRYQLNLVFNRADTNTLGVTA